MGRVDMIFISSFLFLLYLYQLSVCRSLCSLKQAYYLSREISGSMSAS